MELQKAPNRRALIPLRIEVIVKKVRRRKWFFCRISISQGWKTELYMLWSGIAWGPEGTTENILKEYCAEKDGDRIRLPVSDFVETEMEPRIGICDRIEFASGRICRMVKNRHLLRYSITFYQPLQYCLEHEKCHQQNNRVRLDCVVTRPWR